MKDIYFEVKDSKEMVTVVETNKANRNVYIKCPVCNKVHDITNKINYYHFTGLVCDCDKFDYFIDHDFDDDFRGYFKDANFIYSDRKYITNFLTNEIINHDRYSDNIELSRNNVIEENINMITNEPIFIITTYDIKDPDNINIEEYIESYSDELFLVNPKDSEVLARIKKCDIDKNNILLINDDLSIKRLSDTEHMTDIIFDYNNIKRIFTRKELDGYKNKRFYIKCPSCGKLHNITGKLGYCRDNIFICDCNTHDSNTMNINDFMENVSIKFIYSYRNYVHEFLMPFKDHEWEITPENINVTINSNNKICNNLINILNSNVNIEEYNIKDPKMSKLDDFIEKYPNTIFLVYINDIYALLNILYHKISLKNVLLIDDKYKVVDATYDIILDKLSSRFKGRKVGEIL